MLWSLGQLSFTAICLLLLILVELLDWQGRMELIEARWPFIWKVLNNRPTRLLLLVVAVAFLGRDFKDAAALGPIPVVKFSISPPAIAPSSFPSQSVPPIQVIVSQSNREQLREEVRSLIVSLRAIDGEIGKTCVSPDRAVREQCFRDHILNSTWASIKPKVAAVAGRIPRGVLNEEPADRIPRTIISIDNDLSGPFFPGRQEFEMLASILEEALKIL